MSPIDFDNLELINLYPTPKKCEEVEDWGWCKGGKVVNEFRKDFLKHNARPINRKKVKGKIISIEDGCMACGGATKMKFENEFLDSIEKEKNNCLKIFRNKKDSEDLSPGTNTDPITKFFENLKSLEDNLRQQLKDQEDNLGKDGNIMDRIKKNTENDENDLKKVLSSLDIVDELEHDTYYNTVFNILIGLYFLIVIFSMIYLIYTFVGIKMVIVNILIPFIVLTILKILGVYDTIFNSILYQLR